MINALRGACHVCHSEQSEESIYTEDRDSSVVLLPQNDMSKKAAFTLAEVLITLGIIGVVAAMTIPSLINNYKAHQLRSKFLKSYSTVQQVLRMMVADEVAINARSYGFYKTFANYLTGATICSGSIGYGDSAGGKRPDGCYSYSIGNTYQGSEKYKYLKGSAALHDGGFNAGQIMLSDGTLIFFDDGPTSEGWDAVPIYIDINGHNQKPNRLGYDFFAFELRDDGVLRPLSQKRVTESSDRTLDMNCNLESANIEGYGCTARAINDTDYFKVLVKKIK